MSKDYSHHDHIRAEVIVDEHMRAAGVQWTAADEVVVAAFREWARALTRNAPIPAPEIRPQRRAVPVDYAAMAAGREQPQPARPVEPIAAAPLLTGLLRVDVPAELGVDIQRAQAAVQKQGWAGWPVDRLRAAWHPTGWWTANGRAVTGEGVRVPFGCAHWGIAECRTCRSC